MYVELDKELENAYNEELNEPLNEYILPLTELLKLIKLPLNNVILPLVKIIELFTELLNVVTDADVYPYEDDKDELIEPVNKCTELLKELLFEVTVPLIEDDTEYNKPNDDDNDDEADELIFKIILLRFVPPVKFALCVTYTGT